MTDEQNLADKIEWLDAAATKGNMLAAGELRELLRASVPEILAALRAAQPPADVAELREALKHMVHIVEDNVSMGALGIVEGPDGHPVNIANAIIPILTAREAATRRTPPTSQSGVSRCDQCAAEYPSAPKGVIHKCGKCSGGMCKPITSQSDEALVGRDLNFENWARQHVGQPSFAGKHVRDGVWAYQHNIMQQMWECWRAARAEGKREGIEEAAKVAETIPTDWRDGTQPGPLSAYAHACREIAYTIRALEEKQP